MQKELAIQVDKQGIVIPLEQLDDKKTGWSARQIDRNRILITSTESLLPEETQIEAFSKCSIEVFRDFLVGAHHRHWSGMIAVDTQRGLKKIFFSDGEVVFASSNLMDDRLGEVIYRESLITLDQLTDSAVKVDRNNKFGQVLLSEGVFNNQTLWDALRLQVRQIFQSLFLVPDVFFQIETAKNKAPTEIVFNEGTIELIDDAYAYGCQFRTFYSRWTDATTIKIIDQSWSTRFPEGTFEGDLLKMIGDTPNLQNLLSVSKLNDLNTIAAIARLVHIGVCSAEGMSKTEKKTYEPLFAPVKMKIDIYSVMLQFVKSTFADSKKNFPAKELRDFAAGLNPQGVVTFFLGEDTAIEQECINGMMMQCENNPRRVRFFEIRIQSLIRFLIQIAVDNLAYDQAKKVRQHYMAMVQ